MIKQTLQCITGSHYRDSKELLSYYNVESQKLETVVWNCHIAFDTSTKLHSSAAKQGVYLNRNAKTRQSGAFETAQYISVGSNAVPGALCCL